MSVAAALASDLMGALQHEDGAPRRVLLWLDPDGGFTRLRDAVSERLVIDDVSLFALEEGDSLPFGHPCGKIASLHAFLSNGSHYSQILFYET